MNDIDFLNEYVLAQFIVQRIYNNHQIYCQDNTIKNEFKMNDKLFKFIIFILLYELKQGNTIFVFDDKFKQKIHRYIDYFYQYFDLQYKTNTDSLQYLRQMIADNQVNLINVDKNTLLAVIECFDDCLNCFDLAGFYHELIELFYLLNKNSLPPFMIKKRSDDGLVVWLYRSYEAECRLARRIIQLPAPNGHTFDAPNHTFHRLNAEQQLAITTALTYGFCMITGGPGTGKTYTVAKLVRILVDKMGITERQIALVAPTGKAAQRMQESLQNSIQAELSAASPAFKNLEAQTIHRLLGLGGSVTKYHADNPLPYKVIIVDEASMLGIELASQLLMAVKDGTRVILLGDRHQLSAVDAGAVLADLCRVPAIQKTHVALIKSNRFDENSSIGQLAALTNRANQDLKPVTMSEIQHLINQFDSLQLFNDFKSAKNFYQKLADGFNDFYKKLIQIYRKNKDEINMAEMMSVLNKYRILCAGHHGIKGTKSINQAIKQQYLAYLSSNHIFVAHSGDWYHGRVIIITKNDYNLQLYNGDIGICLMTDKGLMVFFENKAAPILPNLLGAQIVETAYAMTIHKSQGSEFNKVAICLDSGSTRLLGRELIYTAITRAKVAVDIYADIELLQTAINHKTIRHTGLPMIFDEILN